MTKIVKEYLFWIKNTNFGKKINLISVIFMLNISVILPFYNAENTLARAVNSILNQTFKEFEIILVNNNSTDKSRKIAEKYSEKFNNILLLDEKKQGVANASNTGMKYAQTKYIARMDADDVSHKERIEKQFQFLEENSGIDLVGTKVNYIGNEGNSGFKTYVDLTNDICNIKDISINRFSELQIINPTIMFRKATAEKYGYYKHGNFPEDYEFFLRWLNAGRKLAKLPEHLFDWYDSETRLTRTDENYSFDAFYETKTPYLAKYLQKNNPFHPKVAIWGAGKKSKKRANLLTNYGIEIDFYIDISAKKLKQQNCLYYQELPVGGEHFILSYVSNRGAKHLIRKFLTDKKYTEGKDFLIIA